MIQNMIRISYNIDIVLGHFINIAKSILLSK